jgi:hypothetical protein
MYQIQLYWLYIDITITHSAYTIELYIMQFWFYITKVKIWHILRSKRFSRWWKWKLLIQCNYTLIDIVQSRLVWTGFEQEQYQLNYYNYLQQYTWKRMDALRTAVICAGLFHWFIWQFGHAKLITELYI